MALQGNNNNNGEAAYRSHSRRQNKMNGLDAEEATSFFFMTR
jgi:hypothetical protein